MDQLMTAAEFYASLDEEAQKRLKSKAKMLFSLSETEQSNIMSTVGFWSQPGVSSVMLRELYEVAAGFDELEREAVERV